MRYFEFIHCRFLIKKLAFKCLSLAAVSAIHGLYAYNRKTKRVETLTARATILASGGAGRAYLYSTAPRGATGDGIAMAWRAGCRVSNMEFMQFHPTCLYNLQVKNFLITHPPGQTA